MVVINTDKENRIEIVKALVHNIQQVKRMIIKNADSEGLKQSETITLLSIKHLADTRQKEIKVSDLSNYMEVTPAAVTHLINSLESKGFIERLQDPSDRRIVLVQLTDNGSELCRIKEAKMQNTFEGLVNYLGEEDSKELSRLLTTAYKYFKERRNNE